MKDQREYTNSIYVQDDNEKDFIQMHPAQGRTDNFGHAISNSLKDYLDIKGDNEFAPERQRVYRNGSRVFLNYGDDPDFVETPMGLRLEPNAGDILRIQSAQAVPYAIGYDFVATMAFQVDKPALEAGDVVIGGYGTPDTANFNTDTLTYSSGSNSDGWLWAITPERGVAQITLMIVRDGTVLDKYTTALQKDATIWKRVAAWLNWYGVGPGRFFESFTDVQNDRRRPQKSKLLGGVANDNGQGPLTGTQRVQIEVRRGAGNSALNVETGSMGVQIPGDYNIRWKRKAAPLTVNPTTTGTWQFLGAIRFDDPLITGRIENVDAIDFPSETSEFEFLAVAVDPSETNLTNSDFSRPVQHSTKNSAYAQVSDNTTTGPDEDASTATSVSTANTVSNFGGYQVGRTIRRAVKKEGSVEGVPVTRAIPSTDYALIVGNVNETGTYELDIETTQNS